MELQISSIDLTAEIILTAFNMSTILSAYDLGPTLNLQELEHPTVGFGAMAS